MKFSQYLELKFLEWQSREGGRKTVREFAGFIGVSQSTISSWWNGIRVPEGENIQKIATKLGIEVYDVLGVQRPDPDLLFIQSHWEELNDTDRQHLRALADKYKGRNSSNEIARSNKSKK